MRLALAIDRWTAQIELMRMEAHALLALGSTPGRFAAMHGREGGAA